MSHRVSQALFAVFVLLAQITGVGAHAQTLAAIPPLTSPVVDTTGTLSDAEIAQLQQQALALQQRKGSQLQILIVPSTQPEAIEQYAQRVFDQWTLGRKGVDDGVLLLIAKDDRQVRIQPGYGLEGAIPDITAGRIIQEYLAPKFRAGDYAGGIDDASAQLVRLIDGESLPEPMAPPADGDGSPDVFGGLFLAFFAALFARTLFGVLPRPLRILLVGTAAGLAALLFSAPWWVILFAVVVGAFVGGTTDAGRYAGHRGWGGFSSGGGSGSGGWSGGGGGSTGWSGGGGSSGGGGASGRW